MGDSTPTHRYITWLAMLLVLAALIWGGATLLTTHSTPTPQPAVTALRTPPPPPPLTPQRTIKAIGAKQFSLLVSYTDQGLESKQATIHTGDTVRFTNNSTHAMSLSLTGAPQNLPPGEYWEYTFKSAGDTTITESSQNSTVTIHVR